MLNATRAFLLGARIADYQIQFRLSCFCIPDATAPVILQVRGGAIVSVTRVSDGVAVPPSRRHDRVHRPGRTARG